MKQSLTHGLIGLALALPEINLRNYILNFGSFFFLIYDGYST
jgi:hypothetical protein